MVRLVCEGCAANLDAIDEGDGVATIVECGYCGATNRLRPSTPLQLRPPPSIPPLSVLPVAPHRSDTASALARPSSSELPRSSLVVMIVAGLINLGVLIGVAVEYVRRWGW